MAQLQSINCSWLHRQIELEINCFIYIYTVKIQQKKYQAKPKSTRVLWTYGNFENEPLDGSL